MNVDEIQTIVDNAIELSGCNSEAELARKMKMLPQNFNQKKKRGTIVKAINRFIGNTGQPATAPATDAEYWKNKYISCMEELNEAHKKIDRLTASHTTAERLAASSGKGAT